MKELWYVLMTRHFETGDTKELSQDECCSFGCETKGNALAVVAYLKKRPYKLAPGELSEPTYEPIPHSMFDTVFPNRKIG